MPYQKKRPAKFVKSMDGMRPAAGLTKTNLKQAESFPVVGMTLRSYNHDPLSSPPRRPTTEVKIGRWRRLRNRFSWKKLVLGVLLIGLLTGGWVGGKFLYNAHKLFHGNILSVLTTTKLKGQDSGRVNILLAGNSADDPGHDGANLTDSIMLISIDTKHNTAFMLSIPRDLWVDIPNAGHEKINDAYVVGQTDNFTSSGYPNGGMGQLEQIVSEDFGVPIDYYALVDYSALKDSVNAVGGITINIKSSDPRGLYDPSIDYSTHGPLVKLTNGEHTLNGEQALDLARARGDAYGSYGFDESDFTRTQDQQEMILAIKNKAISAGVLSNPAKLTSLSDAIGNNVHTDFSLSEVHELYNLTKNIPGSSIKSLTLNSINGTDYLASYTSSDGEEALIPAAGEDDFSQIQSLMNQLTSSNPVAQEAAQVVVLNGTDTYGLASKKRSSLEADDINVIAVGDATADQATTTIIDNSGGKKPATLKLLEQQYGMNVTTTNPYSANYTADFIVVLGADQAAGQTAD
jgi:LCP family protein required for cell wall assembly